MGSPSPSRTRANKQVSSVKKKKRTTGDTHLLTKKTNHQEMPLVLSFRVGFKVRVGRVHLNSHGAFDDASGADVSKLPRNHG